MSGEDPEEKKLRDEIVGGVRAARAEGRERAGAEEDASLPPYETPLPSPGRLPALSSEPPEAPPESPEREELNAIWPVSRALEAPPRGLARLLAPLRRPLQRLVRFALGPVVEEQERFNSAQVRFDNAIVGYVDERIDRLSRHYDRVLGLHGKRMEEIDERHQILQQELIRHVHDLVERIEFVFESAEQNHLYLEGMLRETKEELGALVTRWDALAREKN